MLVLHNTYGSHDRYYIIDTGVMFQPVITLILQLAGYLQTCWHRLFSLLAEPQRIRNIISELIFRKRFWIQNISVRQ